MELQCALGGPAWTLLKPRWALRSNRDPGDLSSFGTQRSLKREQCDEMAQKDAGPGSTQPVMAS